MTTFLSGNLFIFNVILTIVLKYLLLKLLASDCIIYLKIYSHAILQGYVLSGEIALRNNHYYIMLSCLCLQAYGLDVYI